MLEQIETKKNNGCTLKDKPNAKCVVCSNEIESIQQRAKALSEKCAIIKDALEKHERKKSMNPNVYLLIIVVAMSSLLLILDVLK
jgi:predicted nucleic acid-binding Zn ribbon protein